MGAPAALDGAVFDDLRRRLRGDLGFDLAEAAELDPGVPHNNRLLRLRAVDGREAVAKFYFRDDRGRLVREYQSLTFLRGRGLTAVPAPYLRCDQHAYAVYSFESGVTRRAADYADADLDAIGRFGAALGRLGPDDAAAAGCEFLPAVSATFSYADQVAGARARLRAFAAAAEAPDAPDAVRQLCREMDPLAEVERLIAAATTGLSNAVLHARVPEGERRFHAGDFAPHNVLVRPEGYAGERICAVDFEYAGWDDPLAPPACFLTADTCLDLPPARAARFMDAFWQGVTDGAGPSEADVARFGRVRALLHLSFCAVHLSAVTPARVANKRFATPSLDLHAYLVEQTAKFRRRLRIAEAAIAEVA